MVYYKITIVALIFIIAVLLIGIYSLLDKVTRYEKTIARKQAIIESLRDTIRKCIDILERNKKKNLERNDETCSKS